MLPIPGRSFATPTQRTALLLLGLIVGLSACSESASLTGTEEVFQGPAGATLSLVSGETQEGEVASYLSNPLAVQVLSSEGKPMPGVAVEWTFQDGGGMTPGVTTGSAETRWFSYTDGAGRASASWLLGTRAGRQLGNAKIVAKVPTASQASGNGNGNARKVGFVATGNPSEPTSLHITPEDEVLTPGESTVLEIEAQDGYGNPVSGVNIQWRSSNKSVATIDNQGRVTAVGPGYAQITAKSGPLQDQANVAVVSVTAGALHKVRGDGQSGTVGQTLPQPPTIQALNGSGEPVEGVTVRWRVRAGGGSVAGASGVTNEQGEVSVAWTLGGDSEKQILEASADGLASVSFEATAAYPVASLEVSPAQSSLKPGEWARITATARDRFGNVVEDVPVTWASSATAVATVSSTGLIRAVAVGNATITARAEGLTAEHRTSVAEIVDETRRIVRESGNNQVGQVGQPLARQPSVRVVDGNGSGVPGVAVSWQVRSGGGRVSSATVTTDGSGISRVGWTLGGKLGTQEIAASAENAGSVFFQADAGPGPVAQLDVWPGSSSAREGERIQLRVEARDGFGNLVADPAVRWSSDATGIAQVSQAGLVTAVSPGTTSIRASADGASDRHEITVLQKLPDPSGDFNEPDGFVAVFDEDWNSFDKYRWWHTPTNEGTTEIVNGRLVWTYPKGKVGGSVPGAKITEEHTYHGPYQYHRDEGVTLSNNFWGHSSYVNKFRYFPNEKAEVPGYIGFFGTDDGDLLIGVNSFWFGPHSDTRMRWNSPENLASPTREQARVVRGVPNTIETLVYVGTSGNADGWLKLWLNGALILHYENIGMTRSGTGPRIKGVHFAPVWGGTGDVLPLVRPHLSSPPRAFRECSGHLRRSEGRHHDSSPGSIVCGRRAMA
ncbi:MAG: Ig-like domain-containing protein [Gemmatimonadota bacterium]